MKTTVKELRQQRGISQAELADALGVSRQTVISIESERYTASLALAFRIARFFDKPIEQIFLFDEEED